MGKLLLGYTHRVFDINIFQYLFTFIYKVKDHDITGLAA